MKFSFYTLASVDVDRILREMDVKTLQDNIMHITFCNIEAELVGAFITFIHYNINL